MCFGFSHDTYSFIHTHTCHLVQTHTSTLCCLYGILQEIDVNFSQWALFSSDAKLLYQQQKKFFPSAKSKLLLAFSKSKQQVTSPRNNRDMQEKGKENKNKSKQSPPSSTTKVNYREQRHYLSKCNAGKKTQVKLMTCLVWSNSTRKLQVSKNVLKLCMFGWHFCLTF